VIIALNFNIFSNRIKAQCDTLSKIHGGLEKPYELYDSSFYFNSQGDEIFYRKWGNQNIKKAEKVILIIHGIGYHSYPFKKIMNYIKNDSIMVYAMDLRGHGLSGKTKGELESNDKILIDIDNLVGIIKKDSPDSKIYILGSCSGGLYALGYLLSSKIHSELSGSILVGPALRLHKSQIIQIANLKSFWFMIFNHTKQKISINGKKLEMSSRDHKWINSKRNDKLAMQYVSVDYLDKLREMQKLDKKKPELAWVSSPVLIQHGGKDKIIDLKGSYYLKRNLINTKTELIVYPEGYHTLFWDNDSNQVFNDIIRWIKNN